MLGCGNLSRSDDAAGLLVRGARPVDNPLDLIEAWAGQKSFRRKDEDDGPKGRGHGEPRRNDTHASRADPEARLYKKSAGQEAKLI